MVRIRDFDNSNFSDNSTFYKLELFQLDTRYMEGSTREFETHCKCQIGSRFQHLICQICNLNSRGVDSWLVTRLESRLESHFCDSWLDSSHGPLRLATRLGLDFLTRTSRVESCSSHARVTLLPVDLNQRPSKRQKLHHLSVPAISAPMERVSSHGGIIMRPHRASLGDDMLSRLINPKCNHLYASTVSV